MKFPSKVVHAGIKPDPVTGATSTPIYQTSTYAQTGPNEHKGYDYVRGANPTREVLEKSMAELENGKHGLAFSSGMAAINNVLNLFSKGDHIVAGNDLYGGSYRMFTKLYAKLGLEFTFVDTTNLEALAGAFKDNTKLLWLESPTNPMVKITDIKEASKIGKEHEALVGIDSTFATPYLQTPLDLGADIVNHSTTKYINGHTDNLGGINIVNDDELQEQMQFYSMSVGAVPGPFACWLTLRGIKTLALRMKKHCENGMQLAKYLNDHAMVKTVNYPGLPEYEGYAVAKKQMRDFGGMISFELNGTLEQGAKFVSSTEMITLAEDLGGVASLICHPASMTHASVPQEERLKVGLTDGMIRLSVGIEDSEDIITDLEKAFDAVK